ncbi:MAG: alpha/beta hydrolase family protein [Solirubrobacteraceae bacterium]
MRALLVACWACQVLGPPGAGAAVRVAWTGPGQAPVTVLLLHGGGWADVSKEAWLPVLEHTRQELRGWGYRTGVVEYRPGRAGLADVREAYDAAVADRPGRVCLYGESAGGTLALLVAAQRRSVSCVIAVAAPSDLLGLQQIAPDLAATARAREAFGASAAALRRFSPVTHARRIRADVLLEYALFDAVLPAWQGVELSAFLPRGRLLLDRPGTAWSAAHGPIDPSDARRNAAERHRILQGPARTRAERPLPDRSGIACPGRTAAGRGERGRLPGCPPTPAPTTTSSTRSRTRCGCGCFTPSTRRRSAPPSSLIGCRSPRSKPAITSTCC